MAPLGLVALFSGLVFAGQTSQDVRSLEPDRPVERELAGGETHTYQFHLSAGQFMRILVEQKGIDVAVSLVAPDSKQEVEANLPGRSFGLESVSHEARARGYYRIVVRTYVAAAPRGAYHLRLEVKAAASAQDKQRIAAESLLAEAIKSYQQGAEAAESTIQKAQQSLTLWRELADRYWEATALNLIGNAYSSGRKYDQAIEYYNQAHGIRLELKDRAGEAATLINLGTAHTLTRNYEKAIEYRGQALQIYREVKDRLGEANALVGLGSASYSLSRGEKTIEYYEQALGLYRELKDRAGEANALNGVGNGYWLLRRYEKVIEYHEQSLAIYRELKNRGGEALLLSNLGNEYSSLSRYEKAIEVSEQALQAHRELKNRAGEANALGALGSALLYLARYERGIEYYEQQLKIRRELKDRAGEGRTLNSLGVAYSSMSRFEKAFEYYDQSLQISREIKNRADEGGALFSLSTCYRLLSRFDKALEHLEQSRAIKRELSGGTDDESVLNEFGLIYRSMGDYEKALEYHEQSLRKSREEKRRGREAIALTYLGHDYYSLGRFDKALEYYELALPISREVKDREFEGIVVNRLGQVYRMQNRPREAMGYHLQALPIARETKIAGFEGQILSNLMLACKAQDQPGPAILFGKQSVNVYQEIRSNIRSLDRDSQQSFVKDREETYRELADLLISEGRLPEAEQVIRMLKDEEYFEFIRRDEGNSPKALKAQLTPEEQALEKRYREISDRVAELGTERGTLIEKNTRTPEEEQRLVKLEADLVVAGNAFQFFLSHLESELGTAVEKNSKVYALREFQGLMEDLRELGKGTVALYTLVGGDKYRVILTTADFQKGYEYPIKAAELNRKVLEFRDVLQNPKYDPLPLAQGLYKILLGPVAKDLQGAKAQTLMWSLDGVLRYLPVSALHDGKQYVIERYRNVVFTPASQARLKDLPARSWDALGLGVTKAHGERIPALPGVLEEMRAIIREESATSGAAGNPAGVLPGVVKLDEQFTQDAMLAELRKRHKVVHIASHFQFSPGNETNSALLLGDGSFLSLAQIKAMPNVFSGVDLLTLSACNTATGGGANGKEVEGFAVLAQRQGAKAVVASLWPVADRSTKLLMQEFYKLREAQSGTAKIEALRQAQLKLLRGQTSPAGARQENRQIIHEDEKPGTANRPLFKVDSKAPYSHPYFWAPFIMIGNWR